VDLQHVLPGLVKVVVGHRLFERAGGGGVGQSRYADGGRQAAEDSWKLPFRGLLLGTKPFHFDLQLNEVQPGGLPSFDQLPRRLHRPLGQLHQLAEDGQAALQGEQLEVPLPHGGEAAIPLHQNGQRRLIDLPEGRGPTQLQFAGGDDLLADVGCGPDAARPLPVPQLVPGDADHRVRVEPGLDGPTAGGLDGEGGLGKPRVPLHGQADQVREAPRRLRGRRRQRTWHGEGRRLARDFAGRRDQ
jgi:hypothetical protein